MEKQNKKVYLSNGEVGELLAQYQDDHKTEYVVKAIIGENIYEEGKSELIFENRIVSNIYESYKDIPMVFRKNELERQAEELRKEITELTKQKTKLTKELKSIYNPQFSFGTSIYYTSWGSEVEELKIVRIVFTEEEDGSFYTYYLNNDYYNSFQKIGNGHCYLTREEAEKARQEYLKKEEIEKRKEIEENYKKAKEEYEKLKRSVK